MRIMCRAASAAMAFRTALRSTFLLHSNALSTSEGVRVIDMRSDVLTKPTPAVLHAMTQATLDDDVSREDKTVNLLEEKMAEMFGKQAGLFVLSGTMGNLIGVSCHCPSRGLEVVLGDKSHVYVWEQGGISQFSGLHARPIPNLPDGSFDLEQFDSYVRPRDDPHEPWTGLVVIENTQNYCGGKVLPLDFFAALKTKAQHHGLPVHLDGARVLNAAVALDTSLKDVCKDVDSVNFCFSKAVGAPVGSILVGSEDFITRARRMRKALGGGWRKPGPLAAAVFTALEDAPSRFKVDHKNAKDFASVIKAKAGGVLDVDCDGVHSNIVLVKVVRPGLTAKELCHRLGRVNDGEVAELGEKLVVKVSPARMKNHIRVCTMSNISSDDVTLALKKWQYVVEEYRTINIQQTSS